MRQSLAKKTGAAVVLGTAFFILALPAVAQTLGTGSQYCQNINGRLVCSPTGQVGARPYDRWDNGSPARASGSSSEYRYRSYDAPEFPHSFGAYNNLGGFGH